MSKPTIHPVLNLADIDLTGRGHGDDFRSESARFSDLIGLTMIGAQLNRVPPGNKAWPYHNHYANDELFLILEGTGHLRLGTETHEVKAGDVIGCPAGGPETAHQLIATGSSDLVYLALSTMNEPEVMEYPDSGKFGVLAGMAPFGPTSQGKAVFRFWGRRESGEADYWDGEA